MKSDRENEEEEEDYKYNIIYWSNYATDYNVHYNHTHVMTTSALLYLTCIKKFFFIKEN